MSFQEIWEEIGPIVKRVVVWAIIDHMLSYLPAKT